MKLPIGIDDFKELIEKGHTYMDKSLFIEEVINNSAQVQLITRPRRFGKTLNMSMLAYFFDRQNNHASLFKGLRIEKRPCFEECSSRPVIFLSFKELKAEDFETFLVRFKEMMSRLYQKHSYLQETLSEFDKKSFSRIASQEGGKGHLMGAMANLMRWLEKHHHKKIVLLIDEYDSPIQEAYSTGFYDSAIAFMRGVLGEALKGNTALHKAVLTGILRISKESIFSDLNNIEVYTVLQRDYAIQFGFTEDETMALLKQANHEGQADDIRNWYNGYQIVGNIIYNPWSLLSYLKNDQILQAYWVNTSSNHLIHQLLTQADGGTQKQIMNLINGQTVETPIYAQTTLRQLDDADLWSLLLFSGYLTVEDQKQIEDEWLYDLRIPNTEVRYLFKNVFKRLLGKSMGRPELLGMLEAMIHGDMERFTIAFTKLVKTMFSYYDTANDEPERVYHAFVLGLLANLDHRYHIRSNRESGYGRYDLMMIPKQADEPGVILEFKTTENADQLDAEAEAAFKQIQDKDYATELEAQGITDYTRIGIAFCGKQLRVVGGTSSRKA